MIAQWFARPARDNCFKCSPLSFIRTFVDNDLAFAISLLDFARPLVQRRPIQPRERRIVEMAFNDVADEGRLAIAVGAGYVELATTVHSAIAVVVGFTLEKPFITHFVGSPDWMKAMMLSSDSLERCSG
jgi:hypothetical protein